MSEIDSATKLRAAYVRGDIEADEFESRLDALLASDPEALDRPDPMDLQFYPGAIIPVNGDPAELIVWEMSQVTGRHEVTGGPVLRLS